MGLTSNSDIEQLKKEVSVLRNHIELLTNKVFEDADILLQDDSTWENVREKRDHLLKLTDWVMTPGSTIDQGAWSSYRQTLRDLPQTFKGCKSEQVVWPKAPSTAGPNTVQ